MNNWRTTLGGVCVGILVIITGVLLYIRIDKTSGMVLITAGVGVIIKGTQEKDYNVTGGTVDQGTNITKVL